MTKQTYDFIISVFEGYAESSSGREPENAEALEQDQNDFQEKWEVMVSDKETEAERVEEFYTLYVEMNALEADEGEELDIKTFIDDVETYVMDDVMGYSISVTKKENA